MKGPESRGQGSLAQAVDNRGPQVVALCAPTQKGLPQEAFVSRCRDVGRRAYACWGVRATLPFFRQRVQTFIFCERPSLKTVTR